MAALTVAGGCGLVSGLDKLELAPSNQSTTDGGVDGASAPTDAGRDAPAADGGLSFTSGNAHFLQSGDSVVLAFTTKAGEAKSLVVGGNGPFTLPEPGGNIAVASAPPGKRCFVRPDGTGAALDLRCTLVVNRSVPVFTTAATSFEVVPGSQLRFTTDLPSTKVLVTYTIPYFAPPGTLTNDRLSAYVRAIVDDDTTRAIELTRFWTFYRQPWNVTLLGVLDVPAGDHDLVMQARLRIAPGDTTLTVGGSIGIPNPDGGTAIASNFPSEATAVALDSLSTFRRVESTSLSADYTYDAGAWLSPLHLAGTAKSAEKGVFAAFVPEWRVNEGNPAKDKATGTLALMQGTTPLVTSDIRHFQDTGGTRPATLLTSTDLNGAYDVRLDTQTAVGPNTIPVRQGAALHGLFFDGTAAVQSKTFNTDSEYTSLVNGQWADVSGASLSVTTRGKALVIASLSRFAAAGNGGSMEFGIFDGSKDLSRGFGQGWQDDYSEGCFLATVADFSAAGTHVLSVRIRPTNGNAPRVHHSDVPDGRGRSVITVIPLE
jgi:hypothetical protein